MNRGDQDGNVGNQLNVNPLIDMPGIKIHRSEESVRKGVGEGEEYYMTPIDDENESGDESGGFGYILNYKWYKVLRECFLVSTRPRIHRAGFRSRYGIFQERSRHLSSFPWIIHPYSLFRWTWDVVVSLALVITLIRQPLIIAYIDETSYFEHIFTLCVGVLFMLDIIVNFRTGIVSKHSDTITLDGTLIVRSYLKGWFLIDFLSTIPYDSLHFFISKNNSPPVWRKQKSSEEMAVEYLRLFELLKIFRLSRVIRYVTRFQEAYVLNTMYIRVINLHIIILMVLHWISCLHYLVADMMNPHPWKKELSWVTRQNLWNETVHIKYINSVIRALSNMACLGYGFEVPREPEDILCTIISIMIGATFFALFVGNLSSVLINMDVAQKKYSEVLNQVLEYMRFKQIPKELQNRVVLYYEQRYRRNFFNEEVILQNVSDVLRKELQMFNCRHLVDEVPLFQGLPQAIMQSIVARLKFEVYLPQDIIISANAIGDAMFFIEHGAVSVLAPSGRAVAFLRDGDFFGELALITNEKRNATVVTTSFCDIYRLAKDDFDECIKGYPEVYHHLIKLAEDRAKKLNSDPARQKPKSVMKRKPHHVLDPTGRATKSPKDGIGNRIMKKFGKSKKTKQNTSDTQKNNLNSDASGSDEV